MTQVKVHRRPNVMPLSLAAFFNDTGSDMLFAFYPLFLVMILGVRDMKVLGFIESLALLAGLLLRPVAGRISDLRGRIGFIWGGYICLALSRVGQGLARSWWHLIPPKMLYEIGRGVRNPPREALLAESVPQEERGLAFGILKSMDTAGAILGPLLGLGIFALLRGYLPLESVYRAIFFFSALPTLVSIWLTSTRLRESGLVEAEGGERGDVSLASDAFRSRALFLFTAISCLFSFWAVTENFMLVSGAQVLGVGASQITMVVFLYWFINVTFAPTALVAGRLSDRLGRKPFIALGFLVLGALTAFFAWARTFWQVGLLFAAHGVYQGLLSPSQTALVADLAPPAHRAQALGRYSMWVGLFAIPAPFVFGWLWDSWGRPFAFLVSGAFVAVSAILMLLLVHPEKRAQSS